MTYLGVDYGEKRIGLAKGDSDLKIATPLYTIPNGPEVIEYLSKIIETEKIEETVAGLPVSFDGQEHDFARRVREFGKSLEQKVGKPVRFQNEVLTTTAARRTDPKDADASAAALILQSFLDRKRA